MRCTPSITHPRRRGGYPLKTRETKEHLPVIRRFVEDDLPKNSSIVLRHFHSDGGSELVAKELFPLLHVRRPSIFVVAQSASE
jgi:hypothetical protein